MCREKLTGISFEKTVGGRNSDHSLRLILPANAHAVRRGLTGIRTGLSSMKLTSDDWSTVELVIAEILNNIVEHAYDDGDAGVIEARLDFDGAALWCDIIDSGRPMSNGELPKGIPKDLNPNLAGLPEGGFGWHLIHTLTHDLKYDREQGRNILSFKLQIQTSK
jgi:serine/threonine-protein kinase RsbW